MKKLAFLFPGQGSQSVGMLNGFVESAVFGSLARDLLAQADAALSEPLSALIADGPAEQLNSTVNTQPAMLVADWVCYQAWLKAGGASADVVAGHSLGEYAALLAAGCLDFADAVRTVRLRACAMQEAVPAGQGGMAAILGLSDEQVRDVCKQASAQGGVVEAVNYNAPSQVVIAGQANAVDLACSLAKTTGAKRALALPVSAPFHSSLMKPAAERLARHLDTVTVHAPSIPCVHNVDVLMHDNPLDVREALVRQAYSPVRWVETIKALDAMGVTDYIECGPGKVLAGLVKRVSDRPVHGIFDEASLQQTLSALS
jgi:[acyl-carrier-protein] S-malonyltransferase